MAPYRKTFPELDNNINVHIHGVITLLYSGIWWWRWRCRWREASPFSKLGWKLINPFQTLIFKKTSFCFYTMY